MKYWSMKTFKQWGWGSEFFKNKFIGIDEEGLDQDFRTINNDDIAELVDDECVSAAKICSFKQFVYDMNIGDCVVIDVGKMTKYNTCGIVRITGDYKFVPSQQHPRHIREVEIVQVFKSPVSYDEFNRMESS